MKYLRDVIAFGQSWISSRKSRVDSSEIAFPVLSSISEHILETSKSESKMVEKDGSFSKLISMNVLNVLPRFLTEAVFPHCLTPRIRRGFVSELFLHSKALCHENRKYANQD